MKIWADKWGATGEYKGGTVALDYDKFIVTSNYSIEDIFLKEEKDRPLCEAIKRRFKVIHRSDPFNVNGQQ